jgi:hypothetical protein
MRRHVGIAHDENAVEWVDLQNFGKRRRFAPDFIEYARS